MESGPRNWAELARAWNVEPGLLVALGLSAWIYAAGARAWRERVPAPLGLMRRERTCFWTGWIALGVALMSPLHPWGQMLFAAHMTQHEVLMLVSAPLLVLGRPWVAFLFALPKPEARWIARLLGRSGVVRLARAVATPAAAWSVHALALWVWHIPALFEAALASAWLHDLQHVSFFGSALWFWWALWHARPGWRGGAAALLYLFTTMLHSGALGAILVFSDNPLYGTYAARSTAWSLSPLEDQQLGGLIMWVPAGLVYVVAALLGIVGWLHASERRNRSRLHAGAVGA